MAYSSLFVPLASSEGFGSFQGASAVHLFMTKPAPRNVVPIDVDARTPVRETDFEAARLGHDLVLDDADAVGVINTHSASRENRR